MITHTYYDIHDLLELVSTLHEATIELTTEGGRKYFSVMYYIRDAELSPAKGDPLRVDGDMMIPLFDWNTDAAYKAVEAKIASGEWKKADDCA